MFVEYAAEIDVPEPVAAQILANDYKEMEGMGTAAYRKGEELPAAPGRGSARQGSRRHRRAQDARRG